MGYQAMKKHFVIIEIDHKQALFAAWLGEICDGEDIIANETALLQFFHAFEGHLENGTAQSLVFEMQAVVHRHFRERPGDSMVLDTSNGCRGEKYFLDARAAVPSVVKGTNDHCNVIRTINTAA